MKKAGKFISTLLLFYNIAVLVISLTSTEYSFNKLNLLVLLYTFFPAAVWRFSFSFKHKHIKRLARFFSFITIIPVLAVNFLIIYANPDAATIKETIVHPPTHQVCSYTEDIDSYGKLPKSFSEKSLNEYCSVFPKSIPKGAKDVSYKCCCMYPFPLDLDKINSITLSYSADEKTFLSEYLRLSELFKENHSPTGEVFHEDGEYVFRDIGGITSKTVVKIDSSTCSISYEYTF